MSKNSKCTYKVRMQIWKEELLNDKAQHEEAVRSNDASIKLMHQSNMLHKKQVDHLNEELEFADKELSK